MTRLATRLVNPGSFSFTTGTATDATHGSVTSTNPQFSEVGVGTNIAPSFYLSKIVDPITVTTANVYLTNSNTGKLIAGTVSVSSDRRHVTFTPTQPLQPGTYYYIYFGSGSNALDLAGNYITSTYVYFTTAGSSITTGPTVTAVSPENLVVGTPVNTQVAITMSGLIDPNSVGNSAITVTPQGSTTPVIGTVALATDQVTLTWTPSANLATSKLYNVQVAGFRDTQGNLATPFSSSFTTGSSSSPFTAGSLTLVSATPANGATGVSNTSPVVLTFSHGVNPLTLSNIAVYVSSTGAQIAGTWTSSVATPAVATFTPAGMYPANSLIYVYTTNRVQDFAGITDSVGLATTFTVGSTVDTIHPTVTSVTPTNGSTGIGRNTPVVLTFSESVDPATINGNTIQLFVGDAPASFSPTLSGNNRTVTLSSTLPVNSTVTVVATPFVKDLSGNTLTAFQSAFTTAADFSTTAPAVVSQRPGSGATDVPANSVITLFTNGKPLVPSTVNANSLHVSQNGTILNGTIAVLGDNHAIEFTPSEAFNAGAIVQIFLANTIQDVDGNFLTAYQGQLTIAGNAATIQPTVIARNPAYGATGVGSERHTQNRL